MISTILVALDGSTRASGVFDAAATLARALQAKLVLYRALVMPPDYSPAGVTRGPDELPAYLEKEAHAEFLALQLRAPEVACDIRIEESDQPWRSILAAGEAVNARLIVLGSHGFHGWDRMLGTTAGKVANRALRNVMIIHDRERSSGTSLVTGSST
jgi:nucleotide-binding universal stress UspA family protein